MKKLTFILALLGATCSSSLHAAALAVNLISFEATRSASVIKLEWSATSDLKTLQFVVERSSDGINFVAIATQTAQTTESGVSTYDAMDVKPGSGTNFYRLRMEDKDGNSTYSSTRKVLQTSAGTQTVLLEQPVSNVLRLNTAVGSVMIIDMSGRIVKQFAGNQNGDYNVSDILPGLYTIRVQTSDGSAALRMVKN